LIEIIKILEGGVDLRTGSEEPKSLVLSHRGAQVTMPVSDEQLSIILSLLGSQEHPQVQRPLPASAPTPSMPKIANAPNNGHHATFVGALPDEPRLVGEAYDDPETGVASF